MRDSWIDKEEFEELVESFSTPKKGTRRKPQAAIRRKRMASEKTEEESLPASPAKTNDSPEPPVGSPSTSAEGEQVSDPYFEPESYVDSPESPASPEPAVESHESYEHDALREDFSPAGTREEVPQEDPYQQSDVLEPGESDFPIDPGEPDFDFTALENDLLPEAPFPTINDLQSEGFDPFTDLPFFSSMEFDASDVWGSPDTDEGIEEIHSYDEDRLVFHASREVVSEEVTADKVETVANMVVDEAPPLDSPNPRSSIFFGDVEGVMEPRHQSLSERDADRAMLALSEARAKVDQSQLIKPPPVDSLFEADTAAETPSDEASASFFEAEAWSSDDEAVEEPELPEVASLYERIASFGEKARAELEAFGVEICDNDGLMLYSSTEPGAAGKLERALLVEVSGTVSCMLGLQRASATQIADGSGVWQCLISGEGKSANIFAGFSLRQPLDQSEVENWSKALAEAVNPTHRST